MAKKKGMPRKVKMYFKCLSTGKSKKACKLKHLRKK